MLLLNIRGSTVKFASRVKKLQNDLEKKLREEIENLESQESQDNLELINSKKENFKKFEIQSCKVS